MCGRAYSRYQNQKELVSIKIIHTGDWHLGKLFNGYSLLEDQRIWLSRFLDKLTALQPDVLIIAGDIYDRPIPPASAVTLLGETLHTITQQLRIKVMMIAGNHDSAERLSFGSSLLESSGLYIAGTVTQHVKKITLHDPFGAVHFYLLPYADVHLLKSRGGVSGKTSLSQVFHAFCRPLLENLDRSDRNVLVTHGFFAATKHLIASDGTQVGGSELIDLSPFAEFDYIALGHIHGTKGAGLPHAKYAGSPLKYSISEATQHKSCFVLDLAHKGELEIQPFTVLPLRDLRISEGNFAQLLEQAKTDTAHLDDYVFFNLTDHIPVTDAVLRLKAFYPKILGLCFPNIGDMLPQEQTIHTLHMKTPEQLLADFYQQTIGTPLTPFQQQTVASICAPHPDANLTQQEVSL